MTEGTYRVLAIDDNPTALTTVNDRLSVVGEDAGVEFELVRFTKFGEAREALLTQRFDFAVLDLRDDNDGAGRPENDAGMQLFAALRELAFIPIIFYTAYGEDVTDDYRGLPFVSVVSKDDDPTILDRAIYGLLQSDILGSARALHSQVEAEVRRYLWDQGDNKRINAVRGQLKQVLFRRVAARLDVIEEGMANSEGVSAARMYLHPPISNVFTCGDVVRRQDQWSVLLTPACDLAIRPNGTCKAEYLRFLVASATDTVDMGRTQPAVWLRDAHVGRQPRYAFLPSLHDIPALVVDMQQSYSLAWSKASEERDEGKLARVATLDVPYAEELLVRASHYLGRIGSPDLRPSTFSIQGD